MPIRHNIFWLRHAMWAPASANILSEAGNVVTVLEYAMVQAVLVAVEEAIICSA